MLSWRVTAAGYRILWTPFAALYHLESVSRGLDLKGEKADRFAGEIATMKRRWAARLQDDPFYNPNLDLRVANGALASVPRRRHPWLAGSARSHQAA